MVLFWPTVTKPSTRVTTPTAWGAGACAKDTVVKKALSVSKNVNFFISYSSIKLKTYFFCPPSIHIA